jgi:inorganic triphosphatase YgiF
LFTSESCRPVKAFSVKLTPKQSGQAAFQSIVRTCLLQLCANTGPLQWGDAEGLHQARVSIRRLRAAISLFSQLLQDRQTEHIKRELKWLSGRLGPGQGGRRFPGTRGRIGCESRLQDARCEHTDRGH